MTVDLSVSPNVIAATATRADHRSDIRARLVDLNARRAGIIFRKDERDDRSRDGDQEENRDDDGFPDPDDTPVIQEVQCRFLCRLCFNWFHISKK